MKLTNTENFAAGRLVKPATVRTRYCRTGSYFNVVPVKLENGRLGWPIEDPRSTGEVQAKV
jgi:hypothetical protein